MQMHMGRGRASRGPDRRIAAGLLGLAMLLAACGGGAEDSSASEDGGDGTGEEAAAEGEPQQGGEFVYGASAEIAGLDPVVVNGYADLGGNPAAAIYDTLMRFDESGEVVPHLAESLEPLDDAGQEWELTLRDGVTFHDGEPLDGDAVVTNIERHQNPEMQSRFIGEVAPIEEMEADGLTVTFRLAHPWAAFPAVLTHVVGMIASPSAIEEQGEDFSRNPVGAGPFVFESWSQDDELVLTRNEDYWQEGLPHLDRWVQRPLPDATTRFTTLETGEIDAAFARFLTPSLLELEGTEGLEMHTVFGDMGDGITMNTQQAPFDDVRVRQAIAHFIDYEGVNQAGYRGGMPGHRGVFAPESPFHSGVEHLDTDVERGQQLLDEYLAETGQDTLSVTFTGIPDRRQHTELLQQMLTQPNLEVEIEEVDTAEYIAMLRNGDYEIATWGITMAPDPDLMLHRNFHSTSTGNVAQLDDAEVDALIEQGRTTLDTEERAETYAELEARLAELVPFVFITPSHQTTVVRDGVQGLELYDDHRFLSDELSVE